jgi:transcription antitermination factor NusB
VTEPRELAVQALYEADQLGLEAGAVLRDLTGKARRLVEGTLGGLTELDESINGVSDRWRVDRMPAVDRAVLRLALYELRHEPSTPVAVILSEAVRIAKEFSTARSGTFVNGVLAALAKDERGDA